MQTIAQGKYLKFIKTVRDYEYVEENKGHGVVAVFPFTQNGEIILIEQYRPPVRTRVIEVPGGLVGDVDFHETDLEAAKRELLEETGYASPNWTFLGKFASSPAYSSHLVSVFKASECNRVKPGGGEDARENVAVYPVPIDDAVSFALARVAEGALIDPKVYMALYFS